MYYIGGELREIRSLPLAPASKLQKQILVGNRGNMTPPTTRSELLFPFHPFSGVGGRRAVGSAAIAKLLCSYSCSPVGESNKLLVATFTAALQSYEESLRSRQVSDSQWKVCGRSLSPSCSMLHNLQIWPTRGGGTPLSCFLLPKFACSSGNDPSYPIYPL